MDDREVRIRCDTAVRGVRNERQIVAHTFPFGLFIQAQDHTDCFLRHEAAVLQRFHRIKSRDHRAFVVHGAAAADAAVDDFAAAGIKIPSVAFGNDIQVAYDAEDAFSGAFIIEMTAEVVRVECAKASVSSHPEHGLIGLLHGSTERVGPLRSDRDTWDRYESGQRGNHLCPVFFDLAFDLFEVRSHTTEQPLRL